VLTRRVVHHRCWLQIELHPGVAVETMVEPLHNASDGVDVEDLLLGREQDRAVIQATLVARPGHRCAEVSNVLATEPDVWSISMSSLD
jgi:hypothetical protein